ncbi:MAG: nitrite reductase, copper-containing [Anaerolineae bacterium]|nr:nitrite reductase, copper-containing [Anaerolineae bacterium]
MKIRVLILSSIACASLIVSGCATPPLPKVAVEQTSTPGSSASAAASAPAAAPTPVALSEGVETAAKRIGVEPLEPAVPVDQPNVVADPAQVPAPITRTEPQTVKIALEAKEVEAELADGATYAFWTFDGTVPGPLLRVMEGDTVEITLTNSISNTVSHNIDLHAVNGPGGGAAVTNVAPGETKTFTFQALNPGPYIYHCAFPPPFHHIAQGMYGGIVVEPKGGLAPVDREFYVVQGEWYTTGKAGDKGNQLFSFDKALAEQAEYVTFNGHLDALTKLKPLQAKVGETVRIFFGNGGPNLGSNFHLIGEIWDKVYPGSPNTFIENEETWYVPPGSMSIFEFKLDVPGSYTLVDHALWRVAKGAAGLLTAEGEWDPAIYSPDPTNASH